MCVMRFCIIISPECFFTYTTPLPHQPHPADSAVWLGGFFVVRNLVCKVHQVYKVYKVEPHGRAAIFSLNP